MCFDFAPFISETPTIKRTDDRARRRRVPHASEYSTYRIFSEEKILIGITFSLLNIIEL